jgi:hypothetical protein
MGPGARQTGDFRGYLQSMLETGETVDFITANENVFVPNCFYQLGVFDL